MKDYYSRLGLSMNEEKTQFIMFRPKSDKTKFKVNVNSKNIEESEKTTFLGVELTNDLCWKAHIEKVCKTVTVRSGLISRLRYKLNPAQLTVIVHGIILSHLKYCLSVFASVRFKEEDPRNSNFDKLQVQLNNIARLINNINRKDCISREKLAELSPWISCNRMNAAAVLMDTLKSLNDPTLGAMYSINYARDTRAASKEILKPTQQKPSEFVKQGIKLLNDPRFDTLKSITNPIKLKTTVKSIVKTLPL